MKSTALNIPSYPFASRGSLTGIAHVRKVLGDPKALVLDFCTEREAVTAESERELPLDRIMRHAEANAERYRRLDPLTGLERTHEEG